MRVGQSHLCFLNSRCLPVTPLSITRSPTLHSTRILILILIPIEVLILILTTYFHPNFYPPLIPSLSEPPTGPNERCRGARRPSSHPTGVHPASQPPREVGPVSPFFAEKICHFDPPISYLICQFGFFYRNTTALRRLSPVGIAVFPVCDPSKRGGSWARLCSPLRPPLEVVSSLV